MSSKGYSYTEQVARRKFFLVCVFFLAILIIIYNLTTIYLFKTYKIESVTMQPTIDVGDFIVITPLFKADEDARRGELVLRKPLYENDMNILQKIANGISGFFTLNMYKPFSLNKKPALKKGFYRIVAIPGDSIYMEDYVLHVKPANQEHFLTEFELTEIDYDITVKNMPENWTKDLPFSGSMKTITLADDEYFLLCDNRVGTLDSRFLGAVKSKDIEGKVLFRYWPFKKITKLDVGNKK